MRDLPPNYVTGRVPEPGRNITEGISLDELRELQSLRHKGELNKELSDEKLTALIAVAGIALGAVGYGVLKRVRNRGKN